MRSRSRCTLLLPMLALFASVASAQPAKPAEPKLKQLNRFGSGCVALRIREVKPFDEYRITAVVELKNNCKSDQLVSVRIGTSMLAAGIWSPGGGQRMVWPESRPYPKGVYFTPAAQIESGFVVRQGQSHTTEVTQSIGSGISPIFYRIGACEWHKNGKVQASFHDSELRQAFVCASIDNEGKLSSNEGDVEERAPSFVDAVLDFATCKKPEWPKSSLRNEESGKVILSFLIGTDGRVQDQKVVATSGFRDLDSAAMHAIALCRFRPAREDGFAVASWSKVQYVWTLE